jgi:hypothetical protein
MSAAGPTTSPSAAPASTDVSGPGSASQDELRVCSSAKIRATVVVLAVPGPPATRETRAATAGRRGEHLPAGDLVAEEPPDAVAEQRLVDCRRRTSGERDEVVGDLTLFAEVGCR